jgi:hypothetical protein
LKDSIALDQPIVMKDPDIVNVARETFVAIKQIIIWEIIEYRAQTSKYL